VAIPFVFSKFDHGVYKTSTIFSLFPVLMIKRKIIIELNWIYSHDSWIKNKKQTLNAVCFSQLTQIFQKFCRNIFPRLPGFKPKVYMSTWMWVNMKLEFRYKQLKLIMKVTWILNFNVRKINKIK
jgi:hypothetical protein